MYEGIEFLLYSDRIRPNMKVIYFDPIFGASGDMILASLIDLGVAKDYLEKALKFIPDLKIKIRSVSQNGVQAKKLDFVTKKVVREHDFIPLIRKSKLKGSIKQNAIKIIKRIFEVERKVHGSKHLHLHELADVDTILDITGALVALDYLNVDKVYSRPLKAGQGMIATVEGKMPAFNFATAQLLKKKPVEFLPISFEFTTPTAAAILSTIAEFTNSLLLDKVEKIGIGVGTKKIKHYPNLLRVFLGIVTMPAKDTCLVIEANIDDQNPQDFEVVMEKLFEAGALDVFLTPVIMKNSRPGVVLTVLCSDYNQRIIDVVFRETTTLGMRMEYRRRIILARQIKKIVTPWGNLRIKVSEHNQSKRFSIEYQDLRRIAKRINRPLAQLRADIYNYIKNRCLSE